MIGCKIKQQRPNKTAGRIMLIHPRQREGQESWGRRCIEPYYINSVTLGETQWDVSTTQVTRRIKDQKKVLEN